MCECHEDDNLVLHVPVERRRKNWEKNRCAGEFWRRLVHTASSGPLRVQGIHSEGACPLRCHRALSQHATRKNASRRSGRINHDAEAVAKRSRRRLCAGVDLHWDLPGPGSEE